MLVLASDLSRAVETGRAVAEHVGVPLQLDRRLRETHFGHWQGLTGDEVRAAWPREYSAWQAGTCGPVGGETPQEVADRALACVEEVLPRVVPGQALLLATHGGTARALVSRLVGLPDELWWRLSPLGNTCWSTLVEAERGWRIERHNAGLGPLVGSPTGAH